MHMSKIIKPLSLILALSILSIGGSILINSAIASWSSPTANPPDGDISSMILASITIGTTADTNGIARVAPATATEGLRIISSDYSPFVIRNTANNADLFRIDESGNITAKSDYLPTSDKHLATKDYVDAAGGGGDATLLNQNEILINIGEGFATEADSLTSLESAIDSISAGGDATYAKQVEIANILQNQMGWVVASQTYYSVGGNTNFCRQNSVNGSGVVTVTNINDNQPCDSIDGVSWRCTSGECIKPLTWSGTVKTEQNCVDDGGELFDTQGSGTICKFTSSLCSSGWTQADTWQKYNSLPNGDQIGNWASVGSTTFSNQQMTQYSRGSFTYTGYLGHDLSGWRNLELTDPIVGCGSQVDPDLYWTHYGSIHCYRNLPWNPDPKCSCQGAHDYYTGSLYNVVTSYDVTSNRAEIGCY